MALFSPSVPIDTVSELARPLPMQMSKLARTRWKPLPTAPCPGLKNASLGGPCTGLSGDRCVLGEWMKNQQSHSLPPLSRAPHSSEDLLLLFPCSSLAFRLPWGRGGAPFGVVVESSRATYFSLREPGRTRTPTCSPVSLSQYWGPKGSLRGGRKSCT